jgi:UDPglucose 6-dehydrogenase
MSQTYSISPADIQSPAKESKSSYHIVQIGCGVVGYAYVQAYKSVGCKVTGIEASHNLINKYKDEMDIYHIKSHHQIESIKNVDFIMISVCTPLKGKRLDLKYLWNTIPNVATILESSPKAIVIIRSTVPPGTTKKYQEILRDFTGMDDVTVAFQPEFLRAVSATADAMNPWHVVLGLDKDVDTENLIKLYSKFVDKKEISILSIEEAEMLKMIHNSFNAAKISWFNQCNLLIKKLNERFGTDINTDSITSTLVKTCEGLKNAKYGTKTGHAYYGSCLPKDSAEFASLEEELGLAVPLFKAVVEVNNEVRKTDKQEVLVGDFHIPFSQMSI